MIALLAIAVSVQAVPAGPHLAARRCELVTPRGEAVRFDVAAAAIGSEIVALHPLAGGAWPRGSVAGRRVTRPRPDPRTYGVGPNGGGLFVRFGDEQADGAMEATLFLGERSPSLPVAHGLCAGSGDAPHLTASAPAASLDPSAAAALDPRRWPAEDGCRLLTRDGRRVPVTYFAEGPRTVRIAAPALGLAPQTVARRASVLQGGFARGRFGVGSAVSGTDATYVQGDYAARLIAFETGPAAQSIGICGLGGPVVRVPSR